MLTAPPATSSSPTGRSSSCSSPSSLVLGVIGAYVLPYLNRLLTERQEQIRGELEAADRAKADAEEADAERRAALEAGPGPGPRDRGPGHDHGRADRVRGRGRRPRGRHDRIVPAADAEVAVARQAAVEEVTARVGEIVLAAAERVIGREIQAADHQDLIDEAIAAVRARGPPAAPAAGAAGGGSVNPALQGYLAADGGVAGRRRARSADAAAELRAVAELVDGQHRADPGRQRRLGAGGVAPGGARRPPGRQGPPRGRHGSCTRRSRWCRPLRSPPRSTGWPAG